MRVPAFPVPRVTPRVPCATDIIMTVEILKMLQVENIANRGNACHADFAYR